MIAHILSATGGFNRLIGTLCSLGEDLLHFMLNTLNKQSDLKGQHNFILFYTYVADPATFLASHSVLGSSFIFLIFLLFMLLWKKINSEFVLLHLNIVNKFYTFCVFISSLKLHSAL